MIATVSLQRDMRPRCTRILLQRVNEVVRGKRGVSPDTAWLLAQAFGTTPEFWMNLQMAYDLVRNKPKQQVESLVAA
jgi:addiction module HigA family antidote